MSGIKTQFNFQEGEIILIDKPYEWTSFDVVRKIRNTIKFKKIGHAGTLDPLATGLLILCTGKMTKKISEFQDMEKEYEGEMIIGQTTPSYDKETEVNSTTDISGVTHNDITAGSAQFIGKIMQTPPIYSAVKIDGERLYKKARRGEEIKIEPKEIFIKEFKITNIELPVVKFNVICSKGTYIRSLVRDLGEALHTGAYMSSLRRKRIGNFSIENAYSIDQFIQLVKQE